jgi:CBS domain containing-hemolysin-like protein
MAVSDDKGSEGSRRRRGQKGPLLKGVGALFGRERRRREAGGETLPPATAEELTAELVDQAEAFATLRVSDVMTPRADIAALEISTNLADVAARFVDVEHSRMPVYRDTLDDPVGVAHIKDVFKLIVPSAVAGNDDTPPWTEAVLHRLKREVLYVPASMRTADLLVRMRAGRIHMAMVIDEYGGVDGLVTLEDLIEAVVGEIDDEHDEENQPAIHTRPAGVLEADGRALVEDVEDRLGAALTPIEEEEDIDTLGGLVVALAGRVPQRGELILHPNGVGFEVLEADPRRIRRVRIHPPSSGEPGEAATQIAPGAGPEAGRRP